VAEVEIGLRDGFDNDDVIVTVNGHQVYRKRGVTSDLSAAYADSVSTDVTGPDAEIRIEIPTRQLSEEISIRVAERPYVCARVVQGRLELQPLTGAEEMPMM
jgi:hypothetical protein